MKCPKCDSEMTFGTSDMYCSCGYRCLHVHDVTAEDIQEGKFSCTCSVWKNSHGNVAGKISSLGFREEDNILRLVREYVENTECSCPEPKEEGGLKDYTCWRCMFEFNLRHLDAKLRRSVEVGVKP